MSAQAGNYEEVTPPAQWARGPVRWPRLEVHPQQSLARGAQRRMAAEHLGRPSLGIPLTVKSKPLPGEQGCPGPRVLPSTAKETHMDLRSCFVFQVSHRWCR